MTYRSIHVQIKLDLPKYSILMADRIGQLLHAEIRNLAKRYVAQPGSSGPPGEEKPHPYSKRELQKEIKARRLGPANYVVYVESPYAAAQEYGRPDMAKYTFTPYMRPAAKYATEPAKLKEIVAKAEIAARNIAAAGTTRRYTGGLE